MLLRSLHLVDLWSFDDSTKPVALGEGVTVVIGRNNSGKSSLLRPLVEVRDLLHPMGSNGVAAWNLKGQDIHKYADGRSANPGLTAVLEIPIEDMYVTTAGLPRANQQEWKVYLGDSGHLRAKITAHRASNAPATTSQLMATLEVAHSANRNATNINVTQAVATHIANRLLFIPALRRLDGKTAQKGEENFIKALHQCQGAPADQPHLRQVFRRVEDFFRELSELRGAVLQPRADGNALSVEWNGRYLPIDSLGTGFSHVLMMALEAARGVGNVIMIEEPETALHPQLQRTLFRFIARCAKGSTANQFILTTHSSVMLDEGRAEAVVHVNYDGDRTALSESATTQHLYDVLQSLGIRASDLLQANCAIWVEGPSDRLFINAALAIVASHLKEGVHYQIVFYGGSLRSYLTVGTDSPDFVNVLRLARAVAVVSDSDRAKREDPLSDDKDRLKSECEGAGGLPWITAGREIENYLSPRLLSAVYSRLLGRSVSVALDQFEDLDDALSRAVPKRQRGDRQWLDYSASKARIMAEIVQHLTEADLEVLDLRARLADLTGLIERASGMERESPPSDRRW